MSHVSQSSLKPLPSLFILSATEVTLLERIQQLRDAVADLLIDAIVPVTTAEHPDFPNLIAPLSDDVAKQAVADAKIVTDILDPLPELLSKAERALVDIGQRRGTSPEWDTVLSVSKIVG